VLQINVQQAAVHYCGFAKIALVPQMELLGNQTLVNAFQRAK